MFNDNIQSTLQIDSNQVIDTNATNANQPTQQEQLVVVKRMTPKVHGSASVEDFYAEKEANRLSLLKSITLTNKKIRASKEALHT